MKLKMLILTLVGVSCQQFASADNYSYNTSREIIDSAKVIDVDPVYETISYTEPHRECHYEYTKVKHGGSKTPVLLGTLIGGVIGNELGHGGDNKKLGSIAGAVIGGSIGKDISRKHQGHHTKKEKICTTTHHVNYKEEITGYNVSYKYRGRTFSTMMDSPPGQRIKVAVTVNPVH